MSDNSPNHPDPAHTDVDAPLPAGLAQPPVPAPAPPPTVTFARLSRDMLGRTLPDGRRCGERDRVTHLVPVPADTSVPGPTSALCGQELDTGQVDLLAEFAGTPCNACLLLRAPESPPPGRPRDEPRQLEHRQLSAAAQAAENCADALSALSSSGATADTERAAALETLLDDLLATLWTPPPLCLDHASTARLDNYYAGGENHYVLERDFAGALPANFRAVTRARHAFRRRALDYARTLDITQILDIGCGIPVAESTNADIAGDQSMRVVYADCEAQAVAVMTVRAADTDQAEVVLADFRVPETVLFARATRAMLDFRRPVCLILTGLLDHCPPDTDLPRIMRRYVERMAPGSVVIISHLTLDGLDPANPAHTKTLADMEDLQRAFEDTLHPLTFRNKTAFIEILASLEVVSPGVVWTDTWPLAVTVPPAEADLAACFAAVGQVR